MRARCLGENVATNHRPYETSGLYDELIAPDGSPRPWAARLIKNVEKLDEDELAAR